jgi:hypothetical protein
LEFRKPVTLGIIGYGAEQEIAEERAEDYAERAVNAAIYLIEILRDETTEVEEEESKSSDDKEDETEGDHEDEDSEAEQEENTVDDGDNDDAGNEEQEDTI